MLSIASDSTSLVVIILLFSSKKRKKEMFIVLLSSVGILNFFRLHKSPLGLAVSHVHQFSNLDTVFNQSIASPGRERTCQSFGLVYLPVPPPLCQIDSHGHHEAEGRWGSRYDSRGRALREDVRTGRFALPQAWAQWTMKWSVFENKFSDYFSLLHNIWSLHPRLGRKRISKTFSFQILLAGRADAPPLRARGAPARGRHLPGGRPAHVCAGAARRRGRLCDTDGRVGASIARVLSGGQRGGD